MLDSWEKSRDHLYGPLSKLYRDDVWTDVHLSTLAVALVDTPEFQRLDAIKQLGFSDLVFRGAKHTRYLHSVGAYEVARRLTRRVWDNHIRFGMPPPVAPSEIWDELSEIISLAALLHDVTHIPHGHALEDEHQGVYEKHDSLESPRLWYLLYGENSNIARVFEGGQPFFSSISNSDLRDLIFLIIKYRSTVRPKKDEISPPSISSFSEEIERARNRVMADDSLVQDGDVAIQMLTSLEGVYERLKTARLYEPYMTDIVSNTISADLIDYLARDTQGTGLKYAYDERIEQYFTIQHETLTGERRLVLRLVTDKGLKLDIMSTMVALIEMRYSLAEKVYYHKTKVAADVMLGVLLSIIGRPSDKSPYPRMRDPEGPALLPNEILAYGDMDLLGYCQSKITELRDGDSESEWFAAQDLLNLIRGRRLFKPVVLIPHHLAANTTVQTQIAGLGQGRRPLYGVLYDVFRRHPELGSQVESELNSLYADERRHVLIFCPRHKPQAKEARTVVEAIPEETKQLDLYLNDDNSPLPYPVRRRLNVVNEMYSELWKLFVFLHPDDCASDVGKHAITLAFWNSLRRFGIDVDGESIRRTTYPPVPRTTEIVGEWTRESVSWTDDRICELMEDVAGNDESWVSLSFTVGRNVKEMVDYLDLLYEDRLRTYYREHHVIDLRSADPGEIIRLLKATPEGIEMRRATKGEMAARSPPHQGILIREGFIPRE